MQIAVNQECPKQALPSSTEQKNRTHSRSV